MIKKSKKEIQDDLKLIHFMSFLQNAFVLFAILFLMWSFYTLAQNSAAIVKLINGELMR